MATIIQSKHFTNYVVIGIGYSIIIASIVLDSLNNGFTNYENLYSIGAAIAVFGSLYLLYKHGTFIKTKYSRIAHVGIGVVIVGALFKILHITGSQ